MSGIVKENVGDLQIVSRYQELMKASTAEDSVYIKTKETVLDFVESDKSLTSREKAELISSTLAGIATQITSHAMDVAFKVATEERDAPYMLTKVRVDTELTDAQRKKLDSEEKLTDVQIAKMEAEEALTVMKGWETQAGLWRNSGFDVSQLTTATAILPHTGVVSDYGAQHESLRMAQAGTYDKWASSYRANGIVLVDQREDGMLASGTGTSEGMAYSQILVADRQRLAFDDNMRQHVLNSSAAMLGTMIGSATFEDATAYTPYLDKWDMAADFLNVNHNSVAGVLTAVFPGVYEGGMVITGVGTNVTGTSVTTKIIGPENTHYVDSGAVIDSDYGYSVTITQADIDEVTYSFTDSEGEPIEVEIVVSVSVIDQQGKRVVNTETYQITE